MLDEMMVIRTSRQSAPLVVNKMIALVKAWGYMGDVVHDILVSALWGLDDALYVQASAPFEHFQKLIATAQMGRAGVEISWHDRAGAIGYDYGRGNQCLPRFNILRVPCGKCL